MFSVYMQANKLHYVDSDTVLVADNSINKQQKFYSLPINDTIRFDVSSESPWMGISVTMQGCG
jgi:ribosomal protein L31